MTAALSRRSALAIGAALPLAAFAPASLAAQPQGETLESWFEAYDAAMAAYVEDLDSGAKEDAAHEQILAPVYERLPDARIAGPEGARRALAEIRGDLDAESLTGQWAAALAVYLGASLPAAAPRLARPAAPPHNPYEGGMAICYATPNALRLLPTLGPVARAALIADISAQIEASDAPPPLRKAALDQLARAA